MISLPNRPSLLQTTFPKGTINRMDADFPSIGINVKSSFFFRDARMSLLLKFLENNPWEKSSIDSLTTLLLKKTFAETEFKAPFCRPK